MYFYAQVNTVEPLNNEHVGISDIVHYSDEIYEEISHIHVYMYMYDCKSTSVCSRVSAGCTHYSFP